MQSNPDVLAMVMDLNVRPALQLTQTLLPGMRAAKFSGIINITSLVTRGVAFRASYAAAKAAVESLTRTMAIEPAADGITANAVAPDPILQECRCSGSDIRVRSLPRSRFSPPQGSEGERSKAATFIAGQTLLVDGGASLRTL